MSKLTVAGRLPRALVVVPLLVVVFVGIAGCAFFAYSLVARGLAEGRASWVALGGISGAVWVLAMAVALRRARPRP